MKTLVFTEKEALEDELVTNIIGILNACLERKNTASILFSGGSTPKGLFKKLSQSEFDWTNVKIGLVDDRMVRFDSEYSNALTLKTLLLQNVKGNSPTFYPLVLNSEEEVENMEEALDLVESIGTLDVVILGMGNDGHFASLFPNDLDSNEGLITQEKLCYTNAPDYPNRRISHSWSYLKTAENLILFITGPDKKELIANSKNRPELPIDVVINDPKKDTIVYWAP